MTDLPSELSPRPPRLRRWLIRAALAAALVLVLVGFLPALVARTGLTNWLVARALGDLHGSVRVGSASLGWFSTPRFSDLEVRDEQGRLVLAAPHVELDRTLLSLACSHADLGTITIEQPALDLVAAGNDTNLERVLAAYIEGEPTSPTRTALQLDLRQGTLTIDDQDIHQQFAARGVDARLIIPADRKAAIALTCGGQISDGVRQAKAEVSLAYRSGTGGPGLAPQVHCDVTAESLPAGVVATFVRRFEPGLRLGGSLAGRLSLTWNDEDPEVPVLTLDGHVTGRSLSVLDPRLGGESVALAVLDVPCRLTWANGRLTSENTSMAGDLGRAALSGTIDLSADPFAVLQTPGIVASCDLDLARLARLFPRAVRLQPGTSIASGRLVGEVRSSADGSGVVWSGRLLARDLRGEHLGQPISWDKPVALEFAARKGPDALPRVDRFRLVTDFGTLQASGTEQQLTLSGDLDLGLLARRVNQFVDLGGINPAGRASASVTLQRESGGEFALKGSARLRDLELTLGERAIREADVQLALDAAGRINGPAYRVDSAAARLSAGTDSAEFDLLEPVADLTLSRTAYVRATVKGDLARWRAWLQSAIDIPADWQAAGAAQGTARVRFAPASIDIDSAQLVVNNLRFSGAGLNVTEPQLTLRPGSVKWDRATRKAELNEAILSCSALSLQLSTLGLSLADNREPAATGRGRLQGDVARLQRWLPALSGEPIAGSLDGPVQFDIEGGRVRGSAELTVRSLVLGDPRAPTWSEPLVRVTVRGRFEPAADLAVFDELKLESTALAMTAAGRVARLGASCDLLLTGNLAYDLERWEPQLRRHFGKDATITGRDHKPFRLEGSLAGGKPPTATLGGSAAAGARAGLKGEAGFGWQSLRAFGCTIGPAALQAKMLGDGWIRFQPIDATFNQGRLKVEPYIRLDPAPAILAFGKATGVERARLTAAMTNGSLGYAAPLLAGLRDPEGEVSVVIDGGQVPLGDPDKADVWGKIVVHSARAAPGPLLTELATALRIPVSLALTRELVIPFRVVNGRVYHQNLELPLGEVTLRTSGSVGLDGTLSIVAEMPVPARWLGKNAPKTPPTIKLPIGGTLSGPRIDERALKQVLGQYLTDAAGEALKREAEKGLQKWFHPPKK